MNDQFISRGIRNQRVLDAMNTVPRHRFVPPDAAAFAYEDRPLVIGHGQTISQPYIVAYMTELINPRPENIVLEVGTGSGYQAAILSRLVKHVYSIEIIPELAAEAEDRLRSLGYSNVTIQIGDGYKGWAEHSPYDGIVVAAAATDIPPALVDQLKPGGRLVIPIGASTETQTLVLIEKDADGSARQQALAPVRFVPFTGRH